jgi:photosystem II stability/assembly factor-like uncharacterized protein
MIDRQLPSFLALALVVSMLTGCLSSFDVDSVELEDQNAPEPDPEPNPEPEQEPETPTPDANPDMTPDPVACEEGESCETGDGSTVGECQDEVCVPVSCAGGFLDCDDNLEENGCEASDLDVDTCGSCDNQCVADNAESLGCESTGCVILACADGFIDNDGDFENGCETPVPDSIDISDAILVGQGIRVSWDTTEADSRSFIISWEQPGSGEVIDREIHGELRETVVGPIDQRGSVTLFIQVVNNAGILGVPGEGLEIDFQPQGWFGRSPGAFYVDAKFSDDDREAIFFGVGTVGHFTNGGANFIPGKIPQRIGAIGFDADFGSEPPLRGTVVSAGLFNEVLISRDGGLTWLKRDPPFNGDRPPNFQSTRVLSNGRIILGGDSPRPIFSDDFGLTWQDLITPERETWIGLDYVKEGDQSRFFMFGEGRGDQTLMLVSDDNCDSFDIINIIVEVEGQLVVPEEIFAFTMIDLEKGFLGSEDILFRTENAWQSAQVVELPGPQPNSFIRIRFDASGRIGIITAEDGMTWTTEDGGDTWTFDDTFISILDNDAVFALVRHIPNDPRDTFVLMSSSGHHYLWRDEGGRRQFSEVREGANGDFLAVIIPNDNTIRTITVDGLVFESGRTPELMERLDVQIDVGPRSDNFNDSRPALRQVASSRSGDVLVAVGNNFKAHVSLNRGNTWTSLLGGERFNENLIGVGLNGNATAGLVIGNGSGDASPLLVLEFQRGQNSSLNFIPTAELSEDRLTDGDLINAVATAVGYHPNDGSYAFAIDLPNQLSQNRLFVGTGTGNQRDWSSLRISGEEIRSIAMPPQSDEIWLAGDRGLLVKLDGNLRPTNVSFPLPPDIDSPDRFNFSKVYFPHNSQVGWVMSDIGVIMATSDGGTTWVLDQACPATFLADTCTDMFVAPGNQVGVAVGRRGTLSMTVNGGLP